MNNIDFAELEARLTAYGSDPQWRQAREEIENAQTPMERAAIKARWFYVLYGRRPNENQ